MEAFVWWQPGIIRRCKLTLPLRRRSTRQYRVARFQKGLELGCVPFWDLHRRNYCHPVLETSDLCPALALCAYPKSQKFAAPSTAGIAPGGTAGFLACDMTLIVQKPLSLKPSPARLSASAQCATTGKSGKQ
jgi:hypothetical protein